MRDWGNDQLDRLRHPRTARVVDRNVEAIAENRRKAERHRTFQQHVADWVTRFAGSMTFVWLHVAWFGLWILVNALIEFDPNYATLTMIVSLEAIFLSAFILVSQNRQAAIVDQHAELDLQINLLAEYETTRILNLLSALAEKSGISESADPELEELKAEVAPEEVLDKIEESNPKQPR